jgi:hypothetical protein
MGVLPSCGKVQVRSKIAAIQVSDCRLISVICAVAVPADATATARSTLIFLGSCTARSVGVGSRAAAGPSSSSRDRISSKPNPPSSEALFRRKGARFGPPQAKPEAKRLRHGARRGRRWPDAVACSAATRPCPSARPAPARTAAWPAGQTAFGEVRRPPCSPLPWRAATTATRVRRAACDLPGYSSRVSQSPFVPYAPSIRAGAVSRHRKILVIPQACCGLGGRWAGCRAPHVRVAAD